MQSLLESIDSKFDIKNKCNIRFATADECKQISVLSHQFAEENCCNGVIADSEEYFLDKKVAVCVLKNQILGYAYGELDVEEKKKSYASVGDKYFYLDEMYVIPQARSYGIGKQLFKFLEDYAISNNAKTIRLNAVSKNFEKLLNFYINEMGMDFWSAYLIKKI